MEMGRPYVQAPGATGGETTLASIGDSAGLLVVALVGAGLMREVAVDESLSDVLRMLLLGVVLVASASTMHGLWSGKRRDRAHSAAPKFVRSGFAPRWRAQALGAKGTVAAPAKAAAPTPKKAGPPGTAAAPAKAAAPTKEEEEEEKAFYEMLKKTPAPPPTAYYVTFPRPGGPVAPDGEMPTQMLDSTLNFDYEVMAESLKNPLGQLDWTFKVPGKKDAVTMQDWNEIPVNSIKDAVTLIDHIKDKFDSVDPTELIDFGVHREWATGTREMMSSNGQYEIDGTYKGSWMTSPLSEYVVAYNLEALGWDGEEQTLEKYRDMLDEVYQGTYDGPTDKLVL